MAPPRPDDAITILNAATGESASMTLRRAAAGSPGHWCATVASYLRDAT